MPHTTYSHIYIILYIGRLIIFILRNFYDYYSKSVFFFDIVLKTKILKKLRKYLLF